jgi:hypothetical protein
MLRPLGVAPRTAFHTIAGPATPSYPGTAGRRRFPSGSTAVLLLLRRGRHDAVVVLRMLEVVFRCDAVARGVGVTGKLEILVVNVRGRTPDLHFRSAGIERPIGVVVVVLAAAMRILRPAAALP